MNNFSANSPTKEVMTFLVGLTTNADEFRLAVSTRHQFLFNDAKKYVKDVIDDKETLLTLLEAFGEIPFSMSNYEEWLNGSFWENLFKTMPPDDRETHMEDTERGAVEKATENINQFLDGMKTMGDFYQGLQDDEQDEYELTQWQRTYYATGYKIMIKLLNDELPSDMLEVYVKLQNFERDLADIEGMYKSLKVYEFETVTIEEDMLTKIDSVHKITTLRSLR